MIEYRKVAKIVLLNKKKELLLQLRDNNPDLIYPGEWVLFGGGINPKENPFKGLERELVEELPDCIIKNIKALGEENLFIQEYNLKCHLYFFKGRIEEGIDYINKKLTEGEKAEYFSFENLSKIRLNNHTKIFLYKNKDEILLD